MSAVFTINQAGLGASGLPNTAREDGLDTGALVTLLSTSHELTYEFDLLWVGIHPAPDTTSRASLQPAGDGAVSFSPTAGVYGSWRIELVTDRGTPAEDRAEVIFAIKQSPTAIRIPAANERSDPEASLRKNGATYVARSSFNAPDGITDSPFEEGTYVSHYRAVADLIYAFNAGSVGPTLPHVNRCGLRAFNGTQHNLIPSAGVPIDDITTFILQPPTDNSGVLTGIEQPTQDGNIYRLDIINQSTGTLLIKHLDAGSTLGNRISTPTGADLVMAAGSIRTLYHTAYSNFWTMV